MEPNKRSKQLGFRSVLQLRDFGQETEISLRRPRARIGAGVLFTSKPVTPRVSMRIVLINLDPKSNIQRPGSGCELGRSLRYYSSVASCNILAQPIKFCGILRANVAILSGHQRNVMLRRLGDDTVVSTRHSAFTDNSRRARNARVEEVKELLFGLAVKFVEIVST